MIDSSGSAVNSTKINDQINSRGKSFEKIISQNDFNNTSEPQARVGQPVSAKAMEVSDTLSKSAQK
jgi:hypothetical protein